MYERFDPGGHDTSVLMCYIKGDDGKVIPMKEMKQVEEDHSHEHDGQMYSCPFTMVYDEPLVFSVKVTMRKKDFISFQRSIGIFRLKRIIRRIKRAKEKHRRELLKHGKNDNC